MALSPIRDEDVLGQDLRFASQVSLAWGYVIQASAEELVVTMAEATWFSLLEQGGSFQGWLRASKAHAGPRSS